MVVPSVAANSVRQDVDGVQKAMDQLSRAPDPVDAVHLSSTALKMSEHDVAYSLGVKARKINDEIASLSVDLGA